MHFCVVLCNFCVVLCNFCVVLCNFCAVLCNFCVVLCNFCVVLRKYLCCSMYFLCCSMYFLCCSMYFFCFVSFFVLFVCICVLYYCHRVATQLQLTNISYHFNTSLFHTLPTNVRISNIIQMAIPALEYYVLGQLFWKFFSTRPPFLTSNNFAHPQTLADELGSVNRQNFSNMQINSHSVDHRPY